MPVFFSSADYRRYVRILGAMARLHDLEIWAYCLMPNHIHLVAVPSKETGLARPIGEAHRRYAVEVNQRNGWTGHLWQERFGSFPMDEAHLLAAVRYVLLNPVRAGLVTSPTDWAHSSARAHLLGRRDALVTTRPMQRRVADWEAFLSPRHPEKETQRIRRHSSTGRPLGPEAFVRRLESALNRRLRKRRPGPAPSARLQR